MNQHIPASEILNQQDLPKEGWRDVAPDSSVAVRPTGLRDVQSPRMEISPDNIYRCRENLVTREIVGETIIVPISGQLADLQQVYSLNATGGFVWGLLDGNTSLGIIHEAVTKNFKIGKKPAWADLAELVANLAEAGLIEKV
jgi:hypothetical protein